MPGAYCTLKAHPEVDQPITNHLPYSFPYFVSKGGWFDCILNTNFDGSVLST